MRLCKSLSVIYNFEKVSKFNNQLPFLLLLLLLQLRSYCTSTNTNRNSDSITPSNFEKVFKNNNTSNNVTVTEKELEILYNYLKFNKEIGYLPGDVDSEEQANVSSSSKLGKPDPLCVFDPEEVQSISNLGSIQLINKEGYPSETHYVTTEDGYTFEVHRIPAPGKPVILALPGVFQTSRDLLINCKGKAMGFKFYKAGYDVWLANYRGNYYGLNHSTYDPSDPQFWNFSNDEFGIYDYPATIDYVLQHTGQKKLNWVGYSLGSTMIFALLADRPEYNQKLNLVFGLAPAVFLGNTRSVSLRFLGPLRDIIEPLFFKLFHGPILSFKVLDIIHKIVPQVCTPEALINSPGICSAVFTLLDSIDVYEANYQKVPFITAATPSSTSVMVVSQWFQEVVQPRFAMYDYRKAGNLARYGTILPPAYNLSNVLAPTVVFWADNDPICDKKDVFRFLGHLPNVLQAVRVNYKFFTHVDYLYAKDTDVLVYDPIITILNKWNEVGALP